MPFRIKVNIEDVYRHIDLYEGKIDRSAQEVVNYCADRVHEMLADALRSHSRTGEMVGSIRKYPIEKMGWQYTQYVSVSSPHAQYFFEGTQPSLGRYIRAIDRRYSRSYIRRFPQRVGMHPGQPAHRYILDQIQEETNMKIPQFIRDAVSGVM